MKAVRVIVVLGLGLVAAAAASAAVRTREGEGGASYEPVPDYTPQDLGGMAQTWDWLGVAGDAQEAAWQQQENNMQSNSAVGLYDPARNVFALREAIAWAEGTARESDPYRVCYGYRHTIRDLSTHPTLSGEWKGEMLPDAMCRGAGFGPGCVSTAAGKYQINVPTFREFGGGGFMPADQDRMCDAILRKTGALAAIERGQLAEAVRLARKRWASLPSAGYGQGERAMTDIQSKYVAAGGVLA